MKWDDLLVSAHSIITFHYAKLYAKKIFSAFSPKKPVITTKNIDYSHSSHKKPLIYERFFVEENSLCDTYKARKITEKVIVQEELQIASLDLVQRTT